jgi:sirohydrochlorin ferrochelatase
MTVRSRPSTAPDITMLVAAHGTRSETGVATTRCLVDAVRAQRPGLRVELGFLDVAQPSVRDVLAAESGPVVVVPALLSSGYHVRSDIPQIVRGRPATRVARHLGPHRLLSEAVADRLSEARGGQIPAATIALVGTGSSQPDGAADLAAAAEDLARRTSYRVQALSLGAADLGEKLGRLAAAAPVEVASYLLAEGRFFDHLHGAARRAGIGVVSPVLGPHPAVVALVLHRFDEVTDHRLGPS